MIRNFFKKKSKLENDVIVTAVVTQTADLIHHLQKQMDLRFQELSSQVKEIELGLNQLETKLLTKDLKDKQAYGLLHYKLHEAKNQSLQEEIQELEQTLNKKKNSLKDH